LYTWMQVCYLREDYDLAQKYGERSAILYKVTGDRKSRAFALEYLSRIYVDLQNNETAEDKAMESLAILQELHADWNIVYGLRGLGKLYWQTNRRDEAHKVWAEALSKAQQLKHPLEQEIRKLLLFEDK
jgi:hypothetical protein